MDICSCQCVSFVRTTWMKGVDATLDSQVRHYSIGMSKLNEKKLQDDTPVQSFGHNHQVMDELQSCSKLYISTYIKS